MTELEQEQTIEQKPVKTEIADLKWQIWYLLAAIPGILLLLMTLFGGGRAAIWGMDGYAFFYPTATYAKTFWSALFSGCPAMMDFTIGEGLDPLLCMAYYGLTDTVSILYTVIPDSLIPAAMTFVSLLKILFSGIAFGWYARTRGAQNKSAAIGALVYAFSGYFLFWLQGPMFLAAGYLLPLLLRGVDKCVEQKRYAFFAAVTAFAYLSNYYIAVILSVMTFIYAVMRIIGNGKPSKRDVLGYLAAVGAHLLGIAVSAVALIPVGIGVLSSTRAGEKTGLSNMLVFPFRYYLDVLKHFFAPLTNVRNYWQTVYVSHTSYLPVAAPCMLFLLSAKTKRNTNERRLKCGLLICFVFLFVPLFGKLFNGMAYVTHRWEFALAFVVAMTVVWASSRMKDIPVWVRIASAALFVCGIALQFLMTDTLIAIIIAVATAVFALILLIKPSRKTAYVSCVLSLLVFVVVPMFVGGYATQFIQLTVSDVYENSAYAMAKNYADESGDLERISANDAGIAINEGLLTGLPTTTGVWNVLPGEIGTYNSLAQMLPYQAGSFWATGRDTRTAAGMVSGTKYFVVRNESEEDELLRPFGYTKVTEGEGDYELYEEPVHYTYEVWSNDLYTGTGHLYTKTMSETEFYALNTAQRQSALVRYAVIPAERGEGAESPEYIEIACEQTAHDGGLTLSFDAPEGYDVYLQLDRYVVEGDHYEIMKDRLSGNNAGASASSVNGSTSVVKISNETGTVVSKAISPASYKSHMSFMTESKSVFLGHIWNGSTTLEIVYDPTVILLEGAHLYAIPTSVYEDAAVEFRNSEWTNVHYTVPGEGNSATGTLNAAEDGIFQLSVPYSSGWKAYVDGVETKIVRSGVQYMGVSVTKGTHEIRFEYTTPGLIPGAIVSACALAVLIALGVFELIRKKKAGNI